MPPQAPCEGRSEEGPTGMQRFEYRVVPAPHRGEKARGLKTTGERFAHAMTLLLNEMAADGWEYVRADTLPCEERTGITGRSSSFQNLLTFRRLAAEAMAVSMPQDIAVAPPAVPELPAPIIAPARVLSPFPPAGEAPRLDTDHGEGKAPKIGPAPGKAD